MLAQPWKATQGCAHEEVALGQMLPASPSRNQMTQPPYRSSLCRWHNYPMALQPVMETLAPYVQAFAYR